MRCFCALYLSVRIYSLSDPLSIQGEMMLGPPRSMDSTPMISRMFLCRSCRHTRAFSCIWSVRTSSQRVALSWMVVEPTFHVVTFAPGNIQCRLITTLFPLCVPTNVSLKLPAAIGVSEVNLTSKISIDDGSSPLNRQTSSMRLYTVRRLGSDPFGCSSNHFMVACEQ
jgi:hypothetical protein